MMLSALKPYPTYKYSGAEWLREVPAHWDVVPAFAVYKPRQVKNTGMIEKSVLSLSYGRIIVKPPEKLRGLVPESFETYQIVEPGNIVVRTTDLQNDRKSLRVGYSHHTGIITSAYMCLETTKRVSSTFGYHLLNAYDLLKIIYGFGSGLRQNLDFSHIKRMPVLVPPPDEQAIIVRFLDHMDREIQRYIRAKQKLIKLLEEQKQATIHRAITRGLNPDAPLKPSEVEGVNEIPAHWNIRRAKQLCTAIVDCKNRTPDMVPGGEFIVVRTTNIRGARFSLVGSYPTDRHNYEIWTERGSPRIGDVFFTREAPAGEACLVPDIPNLCMGQRMMYFRPDPDVLDASFLLYSIYGPVVRSYIEGECNGSTVGHLRLGQVAALPILWCPVEEQRAIVKHIDRAVTSITALVKVIKDELKLLQEYRTRVIADVVTGKLDVRAAAAGLSDCEFPSVVGMEQDVELLESGEYEEDVRLELEEVGV